MNNLRNGESYTTAFSSSPLLPMILLSLASQRHTPRTKTYFKDEYDFIIVGAGSAGSVLAARLSEISCVSVLLLEAGKPTPLLTEVPAVARAFFFTDIDWQFRTTPQQYTCSSQINREIIWPQGKTVGGSSVINAILNVRGNRKNYDDWEAMGAKGWSYNDVFQYFVKLEDNTDPEIFANGYHGTGGPVTVAKPPYQPKVKIATIEAVRSLGYKFVDSNGPLQHGFYDFQATIRNGQRCSEAKTYLVPAENRTNLDILSRATVTKILFENRRAVGVEFEFFGTRWRVRAKREVIVSAGAVNTPKLLMLSGIGPMSELSRLKIPLIADLPVGQNLQDHCAAFIPSVLMDEDIESLEKRLLNKSNLQTYIDSRTGPLTYASGIHLMAFLSHTLERARKDIIDHQIYFVEINSMFIKSNIQLRPEVYQRIFGRFEQQPFHLCLSQILHPKSRGLITLRSTNPFDKPIIDPRYFSHPQDVVDVVEGLKKCKRILTHPKMHKVGSQLLNVTYPECEEFRDEEDLFLTCIARAAVITIHHPTGTAKMGDPKDPTTVVDPELKVKFVSGLRVVDASIMPTITWGNTNIPTVMIAEKASDMIKSTLTCEF